MYNGKAYDVDCYYLTKYDSVLTPPNSIASVVPMPVAESAAGGGGGAGTNAGAFSFSAHMYISVPVPKWTNSELLVTARNRPWT